MAVKKLFTDEEKPQTKVTEHQTVMEALLILGLAIEEIPAEREEEI